MSPPLPAKLSEAHLCARFAHRELPTPLKQIEIYSDALESLGFVLHENSVEENVNLFTDTLHKKPIMGYPVAKVLLRWLQKLRITMQRLFV